MCVCVCTLSHLLFLICCFVSTILPGFHLFLTSTCFFFFCLFFQSLSNCVFFLSFFLWFILVHSCFVTFRIFLFLNVLSLFPPPFLYPHILPFSWVPASHLFTSSVYCLPSLPADFRSVLPASLHPPNFLVIFLTSTHFTLHISPFFNLISALPGSLLPPLPLLLSLHLEPSLLPALNCREKIRGARRSFTRRLPLTVCLSRMGSPCVAFPLPLPPPLPLPLSHSIITSLFCVYLHFISSALSTSRCSSGLQFICRRLQGNSFTLVVWTLLAFRLWLFSSLLCVLTERLLTSAGEHWATVHFWAWRFTTCILYWLQLQVFLQRYLYKWIHSCTGVLKICATLPQFYHKSEPTYVPMLLTYANKDLSLGCTLQQTVLLNVSWM